MVNRSIIQLHLLATNEYEFFGSPAALFDIHSSEELLISQKSLNNFFSKCGDTPKVYRNAVCEIRKGRYTQRSAIEEWKQLEIVNA